MAAGLTQMARSAPEAARGERPVTTYREDLITAALTVWPITAMFFDGRGHNNETGQESFFSLAHLFLYAGMTVGRRLGRPARHALPAGRRRGPAQVADPRPESHPGRLRRRHPRPAHARARRPDRLHLARRVRLRGRRGRDLLAAAPAAVLRRPARLLDRHPLDVGQAGRRAGLQGLRPGAAVHDAVHRRLRLHHDVPVGVHDQRLADERLRRRLPGELQGRLHRPDRSRSTPA